MTENEVFDQELSEEELDAVSGGKSGLGRLACKTERKVTLQSGCYGLQARDIYDGGFPNCAATVEDGSFCSENDACLASEVLYQNRKSCFKAWE